MKNLIAWCFLSLALTVHVALADTKITQLPLGSAVSSSTQSVFPYVDLTDNTTKKIKLSDLVNLPAFTGSYTAPFCSALAAAPTQCSGSQVAVGIDVHGNALCTTPTGGVSTIAIASSNGFAGSSSGGSTPTLTLSTTVTGITKGNGTAISAAVAGTDYEVPLTFSAPLNRTTNTISCITATGSVAGCLSAADWVSFNAKQAALTFGNLSDVGTDGITVGSGAGAVIGSGTTISQHVADASHNGYLSSADYISFSSGAGGLTSWSTFGSTPSAEGASLSGSVGTLQPADATHPGGIALGAQTLGSGTKTADNLVSSGTLNVTGTTTLATSLSGILKASSGVVSGSAAASDLSNGTTGSGAVVLATSPTLVTPALGTPTALVGTNISGTASGLTAGNVTTNANLTGPITSVGNATSIASQTGTGTKFVVDTSPTLVTPTLGAALATSINGMGISCSATTCSLQIVSGKTPVIDNSLQFAGVDGKTETFNNTLTFAGTDGSTLNVGAGGTIGPAGYAASASAVLDLIGSTRGSVLYRGASGWAILAPGTSTYVLTSNGAGADPSYQAPGGGGGGTAMAVLTKTSDYSILNGDFTGARILVKMNCSTPCTAFLPASASNTGYEANVINVGTAVVTVGFTGGSDTFGSTTDTTWTLIPGGSPQASNKWIADGGTQWDGF